MSTPKYRKVGDCRNFVDKVTKSALHGTADKLFEDDYFIFELIKLLYEDTMEVHLKVEILTVIEQHGSRALPVNSVDQTITALLDVYKELDTSPASTSVAAQLLLAVTTIFIENEELMESELGNNCVGLLMDLLIKVNNVVTRRLRACCCQCLIQMETWKPGLLWKRREMLAKCVKEEKTDVCQDYMQLLVIVISNTVDSLQSQSEAGNSDSPETELKLRWQQSESDAGVIGSRDILPSVSLIMDNIFLMTPTGLTFVASSLIRLVKNCKDIPPNIFKPLMLQCLPSMDPSIICLLLLIQKEFRTEILSNSEEKLLVKQVIECVSHPCFWIYARLLIAESLLSFIQEVKLNSFVSELQQTMRPEVFDSLDVHTRKLAFLIVSTKITQEDLQNILHYLTQLAQMTGGVRVSCALYYILYLLVVHDGSDTVESHILQITRKLFQSFPHLIPLIVDFLRAVKAFQPHCQLHSEILSLLHNTVLSLPIGLLLANYHNYLHVWILSAQDSSVLQQKPLRRMLEIVQEAVMKAVDDWALGCLILSICRTMMLHHHTDILYTSMGDLLSFLMNKYGDVDIKDQARFYYSLLTLNSDAKCKEILGSALMDGLRLGENIAEFFPGSIISTAPAQIHYLETSPITWNREHVEIEYEQLDGPVRYSHKLPATDGLENYWDQLLHVKTSMKCLMKADVSRETDYGNLVAVSFCAGESEALQLSADVHLSYLSRNATGQVVYTVVPKQPKPVSISVRVVFGHEKETYECELSPLTFEFPDFLLPFPWQLFTDIVTNKQEFFNLHWTNYTQNSSGRSSGVESVKILKCSRQILAEKWENALISTSEGHIRDTDDYLFFLPPRFHLLFRVKARTTDLVVHIASDYWPSLGNLDQYLESLI